MTVCDDPRIDMNQRLSTHELDAIVLAGGESRRMGTAKANLTWGSTTIIGATLAVLRPLFRRVMVVTRYRADLAYLKVEFLEDDRSVQGPLTGLARGLSASQAPWSFVVGCDMPLILPRVIHRMTESLGQGEVLAPHLGGYHQPLHAYYSRSCLPHAEELLDQGITSLRALLSVCQVRSLYPADFLDIDPDLRSFKDIDTLSDYQAAKKLLYRRSIVHGTPEGPTSLEE